MSDVFRAIREHPKTVALVGTGSLLVTAYLLAAEFWASYDVDRSFWSVLRESVKQLAAIATVPTLFALLLFSVALVFMWGLAAAVVHYRSEVVTRKGDVERVRLELAQSRDETTAMRKRLTEGDFLIRAYSPEYPVLSVGLITLRTKGEAVGMGRVISPNELAEEHKVLSVERDTLVEERDKAVVALKDKKQEYAYDSLRRSSGLIFNGSLKPTLTIRWFQYGSDYDLVKTIEKLFREKTGWPVTLDGKNDPALPKAGQFKVLFASGGGFPNSVFEQLAYAISDAGLLGDVSIGTSISEQHDYHNLVISVLPS